MKMRKKREKVISWTMTKRQRWGRRGMRRSGNVRRMKERGRLWKAND
jgi:hypothetical protein